MKKNIYNLSRYILYLVRSILNNSLKKNYFFGTLCAEMGLDRIKLNPLRLDHIRIIQNPDLVDEDILGLANYINNEKLIICSNNELLINFISNVLKKKFKLFSSKNLNINKKIKYGINIDKKYIFDQIKNDTFIIDDFGFFADLPKRKKITLLSKLIIKSDKYYIYKYYKGRLFKINSENENNYYLISENKKLDSIKKSKISAFSSIKSFELFPFDLCYESILPHVDEFILGIDTSSFNKKRRILLKNFLSKTKYKNKIKPVYINFKTNIYKNFKSQGRWIANINNYLLNFCSGEYCFYIQADEFNNDKKLRKKLKKLIKQGVDEINFKFSHYIFNLFTVRDPKKVSYEKAIRFFKNQSYQSIYDGYNFRKNEYITSVKKIDTGFTILHLSYILAGKNKLKSNFSKKDGLFHNLTTQKEWLRNIFPIQSKDITNDIKKFKYLNSSSELIKASKENSRLLEKLFKK